MASGNWQLWSSSLLPFRVCERVGSWPLGPLPQMMAKALSPGLLCLAAGLLLLWLTADTGGIGRGPHCPAP